MADNTDKDAETMAAAANGRKLSVSDAISEVEKYAERSDNWDDLKPCIIQLSKIAHNMDLRIKLLTGSVQELQRAVLR